MISTRVKLAEFGALLMLCLAVLGCGNCKHIGGSETIKIEYRDSIVIQTKIDTIETQLPPMVIKDYSDLGDTLHLSTGFAVASAWVNQDKGLLEGEIHNTDKPIPVAVPTTNEEHYHNRDSVQIKEVPVEVEVIKEKTPKWAIWSGIFNLILLLGFIVYATWRVASLIRR